MAGAGDHIDDLAGAYLGRGGGVPPAAGGGARLAPAGSSDALHLVVVGNVPALAGIWLAQLADQCARSAGPVGLVRLDRHAPRAELYRSDGRALPGDAHEWLSRAAASAVRWLVCASTDSTPRSVIAAEAPVLLVTGTDEAALAAARRTIAGIAAEAASAGVPAPEIEIAVVGSPSEVATRAFESLDRWSAADPAVASAGCRLALAMVAPRVERIDVAASVMMPGFAELTPREAIERVRAAMRSGADRFLEDAPEPRIVAERVRQVPVEAPPRAAPPTARAGSLALFPEWTPLAIECPDAPDVSFAIEGGTVHLLSADASMRTLRVAAAWIRAQWTLVAALAPGLDRARPAVREHLLLDDPRLAIPLHRCGVLLHARVQLTVGGTVVSQRIDLNDAASAGIPPH